MPKILTILIWFKEKPVSVDCEPEFLFPLICLLYRIKNKVLLNIISFVLLFARTLTSGLRCWNKLDQSVSSFVMKLNINFSSWKYRLMMIPSKWRSAQFQHILHCFHWNLPSKIVDPRYYYIHESWQRKTQLVVCYTPRPSQLPTRLSEIHS
jgi:hypothetical protein